MMWASGFVRDRNHGNHRGLVPGLRLGARLGLRDVGGDRLLLLLAGAGGVIGAHAAAGVAAHAAAEATHATHAAEAADEAGGPPQGQFLAAARLQVGLAFGLAEPPQQVDDLFVNVLRLRNHQGVGGAHRDLRDRARPAHLVPGLGRDGGA